MISLMRWAHIYRYDIWIWYLNINLFVSSHFAIVTYILTIIKIVELSAVKM